MAPIPVGTTPACRRESDFGRAFRQVVAGRKIPPNNHRNLRDDHPVFSSGESKLLAIEVRGVADRLDAVLAIRRGTVSCLVLEGSPLVNPADLDKGRLVEQFDLKQHFLSNLSRGHDRGDVRHRRRRGSRRRRWCWRWRDGARRRWWDHVHWQRGYLRGRGARRATTARVDRGEEHEGDDGRPETKVILQLASFGLGRPRMRDGLDCGVGEILTHHSMYTIVSKSILT